MARPSKYSDKLAEKILNELREGKSLKKICEQKGMPSRRTVFEWMFKNDEFLHKYEKSREIQLETYVDEILDECEKAIDKPINTAAYRLKIDTIKWIACKLKPKKYGEKVDLNHKTDNPINVIIQPVKNADTD